MSDGKRRALLAFDPSSTSVGWALAESDRGSFRISASGTIKPKASLARENRILHIHRETAELWKRINVAERFDEIGIAFEEPFTGTGHGQRKSGSRLGQNSTNGEAVWIAVGAILSATANITPDAIIPLNAATVKAAIKATRLGRDAAKAKAVLYAQQTLGVPLTEKETDRADACAVAVAGWKKWT